MAYIPPLRDPNYQAQFPGFTQTMGPDWRQGEYTHNLNGGFFEENHHPLGAPPAEPTAGWFSSVIGILAFASLFAIPTAWVLINRNRELEDELDGTQFEICQDSKYCPPSDCPAPTKPRRLRPYEQGRRGYY